jgi:carboxypeptidase family protein
MNRSAMTLGALMLLAAMGCRTGRPLLDRSADNDNAAGTIAGSVTIVGGDPVPGRRVIAAREGGPERYSAVTNVTGGFSIPVPPGKYRLQVALLDGERVVKQPGVIDINESDLDANLKIVIEP